MQPLSGSFSVVLSLAKLRRASAFHVVGEGDVKVVLQRDWCENRELDILCTLVAMLCVFCLVLCVVMIPCISLLVHSKEKLY